MGRGEDDMADLEALKSFLNRKEIYLLDNLGQVTSMVVTKFPGLSVAEIDEIVRNNTILLEVKCNEAD